MRLTLLLLTVPLAAPLAAQSPVVLPVRQLPVPAATSAESLGSLAAVRQLPDGRVLVNDQARRNVLLMDSTLKVVGIVADSTSGTANAYGVRPGGLLAYRGDSTLFIDPASLSMLVIDEAGKVVRVMAAPRPSDVQFLVGGPFGNPGFDANGRLIYRSFFRPNFGRRTAGAPITPEFPDSAALVRFDLKTRSLDTVAFFRIPKQSMTITQTENGGMRITTNINPLPLVDDWAVMSDGTIAIVRGREYRVEFIGADGARTTADKIPYDWQRLTDSDKVAFIDSSKAVMERTRAARAAAVANGGSPGAVALGDGAPDLGGSGGRQVVTMSVERGGGGGGRGGGPPRRGGNRPQGSADSLAGPQINFVAPSELPDYKPVFGLGAVRADMDDRLWVRTIPTKATPGGAIYDVIDRSGKLIDRVQVPANSTIAGFGKGDIVYLGVRDSTGIHLQRVHAH